MLFRSAEIAAAFAREGAAVVVTGRDRERGDAVVARIVTAGGQAAFFAADLRDEDECRRLIDAAATQLGGLTVLVNNATGATGAAPVASTRTEEWDAVLRLDLTAPMWCARAAIPHMRAAGHGSIVNISSRQAERPSAGLAAYVDRKSTRLNSSH